MCGPYVLHGLSSRLRDHFDLPDCADGRARYNIAPQSAILEVRQRPRAGRVNNACNEGSELLEPV